MSYIYEKIKETSEDITASQLQVQKNINERLDGLSIDVLTKTEFDALSTKDNDVIYLVNNSGAYTVYKGDTQISGGGGEYVVVDYGILLNDYRTTGAGIAGEGDAYAKDHNTLYTPEVEHNDISIKDGGEPTRFVPSANSYYRCLLGAVSSSTYQWNVGRCSDGRTFVSFNVYRDIGGSIAQETLSYRIRTYEELVGQEEEAQTWQFATRVSYCIDCTRTRNGVSQRWLYTNTEGFTAVDFLQLMWRASVVIGSTALSSYRVSFPVLTLGFDAVDLDDIYSATPKLIFEYGSEYIENGGIGEVSGGIRVLEESSDDGCQLGILYDPDTKQPFANAPTIATASFRPSGNYLRAAKIAGYTADKDVT